MLNDKYGCCAVLLCLLPIWLWEQANEQIQPTTTLCITNTFVIELSNKESFINLGK